MNQSASQHGRVDIQNEPLERGGEIAVSSLSAEGSLLFHYICITIIAIHVCAWGSAL